MLTRGIARDDSSRLVGNIAGCDKHVFVAGGGHLVLVLGGVALLWEDGGRDGNPVDVDDATEVQL